MSSRNKYQCSQRELYAVCVSGWESCSRHIEEFSNFRPLYTLAYVENKLQDISKVNDMPHLSSRNAKKDLARTALKNKLTECHDAWKKLKLAVQSIWPADQHEAHYQAMGQDFYAESQKSRWEASTGLMDSASAFVREHSTLLEASPMLGPQFPDQLLSLSAELRTCLHIYVDKIKDESEGARNKIRENNRLYTDLMMMFADARIIFRYDPDIQKEFFFETQLDLVSGSSSAGIKGSIDTSPLPFRLIEGLTLTLLENSDVAYVSEDATYRFSQLGAGVYTMHIKATGYKEQTIPNVVVNKGSFTTRNIVIVPKDGIEDDLHES